VNEVVGIKGFVYTTIPEWILDADISPYSVRLFGVLSRYIGSNEAAWPSRRLLAERMHCSIDRVDDSVKELTSIGAIVTDKRKRPDGSYSSNLYYMWPSIPEGVAAKTPLGSRQSPIGVAANLLQHERTLIERTLEKDISRSNEKKKKTRKSSFEYSVDFEELWSIYPRPVDKKGTFGCFNARIKEGVPYEELKTALEKYISLRHGEDLKYTMLPKTFFGPSERWKEFLPKSAKGKELSGDKLQSAIIYDEYDSEDGFWVDEKGNARFDNPAMMGYTRPTNDEGQLVDAGGNPYTLDAQGKRRSIDYWN